MTKTNIAQREHFYESLFKFLIQIFQFNLTLTDRFPKKVKRN